MFNFWSASMSQEFIRRLFSRLSLKEADYFFTSSDGRRLPCFNDFVNKFKEFKATTHRFYSEKDNILGKMKSMVNRVNEHISIIDKYFRNWRPHKVVDIGAGRGADSILFANALACEVDAIELHPWFHSDTKGNNAAEWLECLTELIGKRTCFADDIRASYKKLGVNYITTDANTLPYEDSSVDLIISNYAFMLINNIGHTVDEMRRVLRHDGMVLAKWENISYWESAKTYAVIPIPWGHALLSLGDFTKFTKSHLTKSEADIANTWLTSLNNLTEEQWKSLLGDKFGVISWQDHVDSDIIPLVPDWLEDAIPPNLTKHELLVDYYCATLVK